LQQHANCIFLNRGGTISGQVILFGEVTGSLQMPQYQKSHCTLRPEVFFLLVRRYNMLLKIQANRLRYEYTPELMAHLNCTKMKMTTSKSFISVDYEGKEVVLKLEAN